MSARDEIDELKRKLAAAEARLSEQVGLDSAARENEVRQRLLIERWNQAVWETDAAGVVVADSPSWRAYTGQTVEEWLGYGWLDAIHPEDRAFAEHQWREAMAARRVLDAEFRLRAPDGGWRWTNVRAAPVLDQAERIKKWVGINLDIDERKRAEAALRESEKKYRRLFETMTEGFGICELVRDEAGRATDWRFLELNPALARHTGMDLAASVGPLFSQLFPGADHSYWLGVYQAVVDTQTPQPFEDYWPPIDRWLAGEASPAGGEQFYIVYRDVTERKRAELVLRESEERQAFLLKFSDALRPLGNPIEIMATASALAGLHLGLDRCFYGEVDAASEHVYLADSYCAQSVAPFPQRIRLDDFSKEIIAIITTGATTAVDDIRNEPRLIGPTQRSRFLAAAIGAFVGVPLVKGGAVGRDPVCPPIVRPAVDAQRHRTA